jgi:hypothetical protein
MTDGEGSGLYAALSIFDKHCPLASIQAVVHGPEFLDERTVSMRDDGLSGSDLCYATTGFASVEVSHNPVFHDLRFTLSMPQSQPGTTGAKGYQSPKTSITGGRCEVENLWRESRSQREGKPYSPPTPMPSANAPLLLYGDCMLIL